MSDEDKEINQNKNEEQNCVGLKPNLPLPLVLIVIIFVMLFSFIIIFNLFNSNKTAEVKYSINNEFADIDIYDESYTVELSSIGNSNYKRLNPIIKDIKDLTIQDSCSYNKFFFIKDMNTQANNSEIMKIHLSECFKKNNKLFEIKTINDDNININSFDFISLIDDNKILFSKLSSNPIHNILLNYEDLSSKEINLNYQNAKDSSFLQKLENIYIFSGIENKIYKFNLKTSKVEFKNINSNLVNGKLLLIKQSNYINDDIIYLLGGRNNNNLSPSNEINLFNFDENKLERIGILPLNSAEPIIYPASIDYKKYILLIKDNIQNNFYFFIPNKKQFKEINIPFPLKNLKVININFPIILFEEEQNIYATTIKNNKLKIIAKVSFKSPISSLAFFDKESKNFQLDSIEEISYLLMGEQKESNNSGNNIIKLTIRRK